MKLAYFMNTYPMTSSTFIRREIEAHEHAGYDIARFAIRPWDQALVDPKDKKEKQTTYYLLRQGALMIPSAFVRELFFNPIGLARGVGAAIKMMGVARGKRLLQLAYLLEAVLLKQKTTESGVDHLHTHFSTNSASVAMLAHIMGGPPYSMTVHGPDELFEMKENSLEDKVRRAKFVAAISNYCQGVVNHHTKGEYSDKIHLVRCGLDLGEFKNQERVPANKDLVCVGRLCKAKAQVLLVEALAEVVKKHADVRLVLIGDGEERDAVEKAITRLKLQGNVEIAGWKDNADVRKALIGCRAMVLPSIAEGLPIVIMESFALGRPVVTTEINGIPELVDASCGWLAQPSDKATLVACLDAMLSKEADELSEMGENGRKRVFELHDQAANAKMLRKLISDPTR